MTFFRRDLFCGSAFFQLGLFFGCVLLFRLCCCSGVVVRSNPHFAVGAGSIRAWGAHGARHSRPASPCGQKNRPKLGTPRQGPPSEANPRGLSPKKNHTYKKSRGTIATALLLLCFTQQRSVAAEIKKYKYKKNSSEVAGSGLNSLSQPMRVRTPPRAKREAAPHPPRDRHCEVSI